MKLRNGTFFCQTFAWIVWLVFPVHLPAQLDTDTLEDYRLHRPWCAAAQTFAINAGVWAFDRFVMEEDFSRVTPKSISRNLHHGLVWDNDQFSTNLFAHPYHGSLYFNAARCNGMNFWQSFPYTLGGSLMWELAGEVEPPAINDLLATAIGGTALGELTHRMSALVLNDADRGTTRVLREVVGALISPVRAVNRMLTGEMWQVAPYHSFHTIPLDFRFSAGVRYLVDDGYLIGGEYNPYVRFFLRYGNLYQGSSVPYENFAFDVMFGLSSNQPLIGSIGLTGNLWSTSLDDDGEIVFGLYQFFRYYDSKEVVSGSGLIPYKISETASAGPGFRCRFTDVGAWRSIEQQCYLSGILLGGTLTDHYHVMDRNYNMGSGYSLKSCTRLDWGWGSCSFDFQHFRLFTWKGYEPEQLEQSNLLYLDAQGDEGDVAFTIIRPSFRVRLLGGLQLSMEAACFFRDTHYRYHHNVCTKTLELNFSLCYGF